MIGRLAPLRRCWWSLVATALCTASIACSGALGWSDADRAFVAGMLPHHHLGMMLMEDGTIRSSDVRLRRLVFEMSGYHSSESNLLDRWAAEHDIDAATVFPGDLPASDLGRLESLEGVEYDTWWLDLMIRHHLGAVAMADDVLARGTVDDVQRLADDVRRVQAGEIDAMEELLGSMCADVATDPMPSACAAQGFAP